MSDRETFDGACIRVSKAQSLYPDADFWVAIEGGIERWGDEMMICAWVVVVDKKGRMGKTRTESFFLAPAVAELVNQGLERGLADDKIFGITNSKHNLGASGILTNGIHDRTALYSDAVVLALIPFMQENFIN